MNFSKEPQAGNNLFIKLKDGESIQGILSGDPLEFYVKWEGEGNNRHKIYCDENEGRFRFMINFITKDSEGLHVAKVLEQGPKMYGDFKDLNEDYDLANTVIKIKRKGSGQFDTEYSVMPMPKPLDEKTLIALKAVELNDLGSVIEESKKDHALKASGPDFNSSEEIPF